LTLQITNPNYSNANGKSINDGLYTDPTQNTQVLDYIRLNIRENISLKNLSDKACMSTTSFIGISKELGMSPIEFVIQEN
jgi:AraC-like DNA-binding protein